MMAESSPPASRASFRTTSNEALLLEAKKSIKHVDRGTVVEVARVVMEIIEDTDGVDGAEAQQHAIAIVRALIVDLAPEDEKEWLLAFVDQGTLATVISTVISATKGLYNLNRATASVSEYKCTQILRCLQLR